MNNQLRFVCGRHLQGFSLAVILAGGIARPARAQVTASVSRRVEDVSGSAVAGAVVIVTSLETGASRVVTTDAAGTCRVSLLPAGRYDVKAEPPGFKSTLQGRVQPAVALPRVHSGNWTAGLADRSGAAIHLSKLARLVAYWRRVSSFLLSETYRVEPPCGLQVGRHVRTTTTLDTGDSLL